MNHEPNDVVQDRSKNIADHSLFADLCHPIREKLRIASFRMLYDRKAKLFIEGQKARGAFVLCTGRAKLFTSSNQGREIILRFAGPGDILGLSSVVSSRPYAATAEMMVAGDADFIPQDSLRRLMKDYDEFAIAVAEQLSANYYPLHEAARSLGLTTHLAERLAKLLLSWMSNGNEDANGYSFKLPLSHQEIADTVGVTREAVSRTLSEFRRKHLLRSENGELAIINRFELERIVQF